MPQIRQYINQKAINEAPMVEAAWREERRGNSEEAAIHQGAEGLARGAEAIGDFVGQQEVASKTNELQTATANLEGKYQQALQNGDSSDPKFITDFIQNEVDPAVREFQGGTTTKAGEAFTREAGQRLAMGWMGRASSDYIGAVKDKQAAATDEAVNGFVNGVRTNPETIHIVAPLAATVVAHNAPAEHRAEMSQKANAKLWDASANGLVDQAIKNPNATPESIAAMRTHLTDPQSGYQQSMEPGDYNWLLGRIDSVQATQQGVQGALIKQQFPDMLKAIENGANPSQARAAIAAYSGKTPRDTVIEKADMQRQLDFSTQYQGIFKKLMDAPDYDIQQAQMSAHTQWAGATSDQSRIALSAQEKAIAAVRDRRNQEFSADPAQYAIANNEAVGVSAQAFAKDPGPQTFQAYAQRSIAYQEHLYPDRVPHVVTKEITDSMTQAVHAIADNPKNAQVVGQTFAGWAKTTGAMWPQIARELHADHVLNDDQYVGATLYGNPKTVPLGNWLIQASAMNEKDLFTVHGVSEAAAYKAVIPQLQPLSASLSTAGVDGQELMTAYTKAAAHLVQLRGDPTAAKGIVDDMIMSHYAFGGRDGALRVPNRPGINADAVFGAARFVQDNMQPQHLVIPKADNGMPQGEYDSHYLETMKDSGIWVTTGDEKGAMLVDPATSQPYLEKSKTGNVPIVRTWSQLQGGQ